MIGEGPQRMSPGSLTGKPIVDRNNLGYTLPVKDELPVLEPDKDMLLSFADARGTVELKIQSR